MKMKSTWFYIVSVFFDIVAIFTFAAGNNRGTGVVWLCLGSCFLCLGAYFSRKEQEKNKTDESADESERTDADPPEQDET